MNPFRSPCRLAVFPLCILVLAQVALCAPGLATEVIPWGRRDLSIPYRWSSSKESSAASQVVLYVSVDQGRNWNQVSTATPQVRSFLYQAPADGEYWFALRTFDRYGGHQPQGTLQPEMRVSIDTEGPRVIRLDGLMEQGALRVSMEAADATRIDPESVQFFAQPEGATAWTPVAIVPGSLRTIDGGRGVTVQGEWRPPLGTNGAKLRAVVSDSAGTRAESTAQARVESSSSSLMMQTPTRLPVQKESPSVASSPPVDHTTASKNPFDQFDAQWAARKSAPFQFASATPAAASPQASGADTFDQPQESASQTPAGEAWPVDRARTRSFTSSQPPSQEPPLNARNPFSTASISNHATPMGPPAASFAPAERHVGATEFEFDYQLSQTGSWGVAKVELWGTEDGGATWRRFAIDSDRQSPIHVSVPGEGLYGFKILVESIGGLAPSAPRPGDKPEALVRVDLQKPRVVLTRVEQGLGYLADQVTIDWRIDEEHPIENGVDLFYSNRSTGPWIPIATSVSSGAKSSIGLGGAGRYSWRLQRHLPEQLYVRVEARDMAGNVGASVSQEAVIINLPNPSGSLLGVRAVAE